MASNRRLILQSAAVAIAWLFPDGTVEAFDRVPWQARRVVREMVAARALRPRDVAEGRVTQARLRRTGEPVFVVEGAPENKDVGGFEIQKRPVFIAARRARTLGGRRWFPIDELPRPQDRHEVLMDLSDGRVLNAFEFASLVTRPTPMHVFTDGSQYGPRALRRLKRNPDPLRARLFREHSTDIQGLLNHVMLIYQRSVFEGAHVHRLRSVQTGDEIYLAEVETTFGTHQLYFGDPDHVGRAPVLRNHQVTRDHSLADLDVIRTGREFIVLQSTVPDRVHQRVSVETRAGGDIAIFRESADPRIDAANPGGARTPGSGGRK